MKQNNFTEKFYRSAGYFVVVLISLVYVASSLINISKTGKSIYEIVASGVLSLIVGIMINGVFRSIGIRRGDEDERTVATNALHAKTVDEIAPYIDKLDEFCEKENRRVLREIRTRILAKEGMKYSDYFDSDGGALENAKCKMQSAKLTIPQSLRDSSLCTKEPLVCKMQISDTPRTRADRRCAIGEEELMQGSEASRSAKLESLPQSPAVTAPPSGGALGIENAKLNCRGDSRIDREIDKARAKTFKKALRVRVKPLVSSNLTSDGVKADDPFDFGRSKKEFTSQKNASDMIIKLLMAVIFGYFGVSLASQVNVASIIWNALQIVLYVTGGVIQMYSSYMWVVDDYRGSVIKKIDYLQKFKMLAQSTKA